MRPLIGSLRLSLFIVWCALGIPLQWLVMLFTRGPATLIIPLYWHRVLCALLGLKVEVEGEPAATGRVVIAANHVSYLDIPVFSTVAPWSFVARADVAEWPLFGTLARLQQTAFTSRSRVDAGRDKDTLSGMLAQGKNLILFPEGTSSDGGAVLPFKSSLLAALNGQARLVQPVTLALLEVDGKPADTGEARDLYAWHGDMTMPPHLWAFAKSRGARLRLIFHSPLPITEATDRKALARQCQEIVAEGLRAAQASQGWRSLPEPATLPPVKENTDELFKPGSHAASELPAG